MARQKTSLATCLVAQSPLRPLVQAGLGALHQADRALIATDQRTHVGDSLDLDSAMQAAFPDAHRWDYILSVPARSKLVGLEPHPARDSEITVLITKRRNAIDHLRDHLPAHHRVAEWYWVSRGRVGFSKMERVRRLLDQNGIKFEGHTLRSLA